jgi:hypothetical protein
MNATCERCGRPVRRPNDHQIASGFPDGRAGGKRLYFVHDFLGCDSGCCGHRFYVVDTTGHVVWSHFMLDEHSRDTLECEARELARRSGIEVDWSACDYFGHEDPEVACFRAALTR